jgi:GNAT superfamily N-acetyltransferase
MFKYKRPESLTFPQTYYKFNAKDKNSDKIVEYRVQDLPEEYFEQAVNFMVKYFIPDETLCMSLGIPSKAAPIKEFSDFWMGALKEKLSIACFKNDGSEELVGANVLLVSSKDDIDDANVSWVLCEWLKWLSASCFCTKSVVVFCFGLRQIPSKFPRPSLTIFIQNKPPSQYQDQDVLDVLQVITYTSKEFDVFSAYNVYQYLTAFGLCVNPEYRGRGIATEILKARAPILKALGLKVTSTAFTGIGSQTAAKKAGYKEVYVIDYAEIAKKFERFDFSKSVTKQFKTLALEIWDDMRVLKIKIKLIRKIQSHVDTVAFADKNSSARLNASQKRRTQVESPLFPEESQPKENRWVSTKFQSEGKILAWNRIR